jgi:hypothetical protein
MKDIIEDCIDEKLDASHFPFLGGQRQGGGMRQAPTRYDSSGNTKRGSIILLLTSCLTGLESAV